MHVITVAQVQSLALELPYATGTDKKKKEEKSAEELCKAQGVPGPVSLRSDSGGPGWRPRQAAI